MVISSQRWPFLDGRFTCQIGVGVTKELFIYLSFKLKVGGLSKILTHYEGGGGITNHDL